MPRRPLKLATIQTQKTRELDFDIETVSAGFDDPNWVPQKITCIAWSWIGSDEVKVKTCGGSLGLYEEPDRRRELLAEFLVDLAQATIVTGHNILRFDLPIVNAECMRLGLPDLRPVKVRDTIRLGKRKGLKKGLDNLGGLLETYERKKAMNWQEWQDAYAAHGWPEVIDRARSDVVMHKQVRQALLDSGRLKGPVVWRP